MQERESQLTDDEGKKGLYIGGVRRVRLSEKISNVTEDFEIWNFMSITKKQNGRGQRARRYRR
jgi:hypothetical protein